MSDLTQAVFVLGTPQSGARVLARALALNGFKAPGEALEAEINALNRSLLEALGSARHDEGEPTLPDTWHDSRWLDQARQILGTASRDVTRVVVSDPLLARLLPLWLAASREVGCDPRAVLVVRPEAEVSQSEHTPSEPPPRTRQAMRWLRSLLDAELHSRAIDRQWLTHRQLRDRPGESLQGLLDTLSLPEAERTPRIDSLDFDNDVGSIASGFLPDRFDKTCRDLYCRLETSLDENPGYVDPSPFETIHRQLDEVSRLYRNVQSAAPRVSLSQTLSVKMAQALGDRMSSLDLRPGGKVLFVYEDATTKSYQYRVENRRAPLAGANWQTTTLPVSHPDWETALSGVDLTIVQRAAWNANLAKLFLSCRSRDIAIGADVDDLIFDERVIEPETFPILSTPWGDRDHWKQTSRLVRRTLSEADFVLVSTGALAEEVRKVNSKPIVVANGLSASRLQAAESLLSETRSEEVARIGYASGTPTHHRDIRVIEDALAATLEAHPTARLVLLGHLDLLPDSPLSDFDSQIERRPLVPFEDLPRELYRFDINLVPLEADNPFCQAKSELKYFEAALVGVPSVATPTQPLADAIIHQRTGLLAESKEEWIDGLNLLLNNPTRRREMGRSARADAIATFGPEPQAYSFLAATAECVEALFRASPE